MLIKFKNILQQFIEVVQQMFKGSLDVKHVSMRELISIIEDYLKTDGTDYAILVNGEWGSGKTRFVKDKVKASIESIECRVCDGEKANYEFVYMSLYGVTGVKDLRNKLLLEVYPIAKSKFGGLIGFAVKTVAESVTSADMDKVSDFLGSWVDLPPNKVLVLDDLERMPADIINDVLGFVNTYTEHHGTKVIVVADEEQLAKHHITYKAIKEKVFRFTYQFKPDVDEVFDLIIEKNYDDVYRQYLKGRRDFILGIFRRSEVLNLRTLKFVLDIMNGVFTFLSSKKDELSDDFALILDKILFAIAVYSIEYKLNQDKSRLSQILALSDSYRDTSPINIAFSRLMVERMNVGKEKEVEVTEEQKFFKEFEQKYVVGNERYFELDSSLIEYIESGYLDKAKLSEFVSTIVKRLDSARVSEEYAAKSRLDNCMNLDDNALGETVDSVLSFVSNGAYNIKEYPNIILTLSFLQSRGVGNVSVDDGMVDLFKEGLKKAIVNADYIPHLKLQLDRGLYVSDEKVRQVFDYAIELNDGIAKSREEGKVKSVWEKFQPETIDAFIQLMESDWVKGLFLYDEKCIPVKEFIERYKLFSNPQKFRLNECLSRFSLRYLASDKMKDAERPFFNSLIRAIEEEIALARNGKSISMVHLENLLIEYRAVFNN
jgi:hypothetical protein